MECKLVAFIDGPENSPSSCNVQMCYLYKKSTLMVPRLRIELYAYQNHQTGLLSGQLEGIPLWKVWKHIAINC